MKQHIFNITAVAVLIAGMLSAMVAAPVMLQSAGVDAPNFTITVRAADADPSPGSGIINIFVVESSAFDGLKDGAITEATSGVIAHFDATPPTGDFSGGSAITLSGNVPYNEDFSIIITAEYNYTVAYNTTADSWDADYVKATLQSDDLSGIGTEQDLTESVFFGESGSGTSRRTKINFHRDGQWSIAHGETVSCDVVINGYW